MSVLKAILEAENINVGDLDLKYTVNEYTEIIESGEELHNFPFKFTADQIRYNVTESQKYAICSITDVERLIREQECSIDDALCMMQKVLSDEGFDITLGKIGVCVQCESANLIIEACNKDSRNADRNKKIVKERTDLLKGLQSRGVKLFKNK